MNIKNNFLNRMTRRKGSTPAEPEEGAYEIPPPSAIGQMASDSSRRAESMESGYGLDLELLASDKPPRADSANGMNAQESGHAPALESSPQPISDESPDAPKPPRALEMHQEYGLELEVLAASESSESPDAPEPLEEHEEAGSGVAEIVAEASASEPEISQESEPEVIVDAASESEESLAAPGSSESPDEVVASHAPEPLPEDEVSSSIPVAPGLPLEQPDEPTESPIANIGYFSLVRDARGNWRPGKGFSRSELEAAGLSLAEAARLRIRIDKRRRNAHPMNVEILEKAKNGG